MKKLFDKKVFYVTFVLWTILHITGISNFYFSGCDNLKIILFKILHLIFLYFLNFSLFNLYKKRKTKEGKIKWRGFIICFAILFIFLLITWPGVWCYDDVDILNGAYHLSLTAWQHFFSGLFYIMSLQTIPIPSGVIIIQLLINAIIMGSILSKIISIYGDKHKKLIFISLVCIFLFPPVLLYQLSGFRMGIYPFFELYLVIELLLIYKENKKLQLIDLIKLCFFIIIVSCWRTEGIYYCILSFALLFIFCRNKINNKQLIISFFIVLISSFGIMKFNNYLIGNDSYSLTATINPVSSLVKVAKKSDKEELKAIDKVLNIDYILEHPEMNGENYFWSGKVVKKFSSKDHSEYLKAYMKLSLKYPGEIIKSMWDIFYRGGSGSGKDNKQTTYNMLPGTVHIFDKTYSGNKEWNSLAEKWKNPISESARNNVALFLGGIDINKNVNIIHNIFWSYLIPIVLLFVVCIIKLIKKEWFKLLLTLTVMARVPLLFITSPAPYFMYYLSTYLCAYVLTFLTIYELCTDDLKKIKKDSKWGQFFNFVLVSGIGWCIDFCVYMMLTSIFDLKVLFANILSSIPAITYVFLMSNKKIFKNEKSKYSLKTKYAIYFGYQIVLLLLVSSFGNFLYDLLFDLINVPLIVNNLKIIIKILITPITMTINFIVMKNLIEKI